MVAGAAEAIRLQIGNEKEGAVGWDCGYAGAYSRFPSRSNVFQVMTIYSSVLANERRLIHRPPHLLNSNFSRLPIHLIGGPGDDGHGQYTASANCVSLVTVGWSGSTLLHRLSSGCSAIRPCYGDFATVHDPKTSANHVACNSSSSRQSIRTPPYFTTAGLSDAPLFLLWYATCPI